MLLFNELDQLRPITVYNQYAKYPDLSFFDNKFLKSKAYIYFGKNYSIKTKKTYPLNNEIKHFFEPKIGPPVNLEIPKFDPVSGTMGNSFE